MNESFTLVRLTSLVVGVMCINGLACTANLQLSTHSPTELYVKGYGLFHTFTKVWVNTHFLLAGRCGLTSDIQTFLALLKQFQ